MNLKKLFKILFLGPLIPLIGVPEDGDGEESKTDDSTNVDDLKTDDDSNKNDSDSSKEDEKLYSAAELESKIQKRLKRDRIQQRKIFDDEIAKDNLTEVEKIKLERDNAKKEAEEVIKNANNQLIKATVKEFAVKLNIIDSDAAYALMNLDNVEIENGKVSGVEESLKELIKNKTYLVKQVSNDNKNIGDDQSGGTKTKNNSINDWIRKAAGRQS